MSPRRSARERPGAWELPRSLTGRGYRIRGRALPAQKANHGGPRGAKPTALALHQRAGLRSDMAGPARPPWRGFTLSDVLIALASCGLLVVMVAPKIDSQKYAIEDALP